MDQASIAEAVKQICQEKGISFESVIETIEAALAAAYRKDFGEKNQNIKVDFDIETGQIKVADIKTVVEDVPEEELLKIEAEEEKRAEEKEGKKIEKKAEEPMSQESAEDEEEKKRFNPKTEIQISEAKKIKKTADLGEEIVTDLTVPGEFGRMAAQTAKQVITQKLRETEREVLYDEFKKREGEIIVGVVQRHEGRLVLVDLGRLTALLPPEEQIESEGYAPGSHIKVYIISVTATTKGPEIIVSRSHPEIVKKLFALEIPEIANGVVVIKGIAREAGSRSKVAVWTDQENIDPIGSCIGQRGARIQTIISELKGEKVDIIKYSENPAEFIGNALSPAKIIKIELNEETKTATAVVNENQLSLAIGRAGQNVRLAARLSGWKIDVVAGNETEVGEQTEETKTEDQVDENNETTNKDTEQSEKKEEKPAEEKKVKKEKKEKKKKETKENTKKPE